MRNVSRETALRRLITVFVLLIMVFAAAGKCALAQTPGGHEPAAEPQQQVLASPGPDEGPFAMTPETKTRVIWFCVGVFAVLLFIAF